MKKKYIPIALFIFLTLSQVIPSLLRIDHWPFSSYAMFSEPEKLSDVAAFRLQAKKMDGNEIIVTLAPHKTNWMVYDQNVQKNNITAVESQMRRDLKDYLADHSEYQIQDFKSVNLVLTKIEKQGKDVAQLNTVLHTLQL